MEVAIVTGASRGIGQTISERLLEMGYHVYGISRDFSGRSLRHANFREVVCDLRDQTAVESCFRKLVATESVNLLINNAGVGHFGPHETLSPQQMADMVQTNLLAPMLSTNLCLSALRESQGTIINISSTAALESQRFGCAYAATKAGLLKFSESLFQEVRKQGIKVITICPDMTKTSFHVQADFEPAEDEGCHLKPGDIADAVEGVLRQPSHMLTTQIVLRPQRFQLKRKR